MFGQKETLRALIDPASQDSFVTSSAVQSLGLTKSSANVKVSGVGGAAASKRSSQVELHLSPHYPSQQQFHTTTLVISNITSRLPERYIPLDTLPQFPNNIVMADPAFNQPGQIDLLLGADMFAEIIKAGTNKYNNNKLLLQNTELGWILAGRMWKNEQQESVERFCFITMSELDEQMRTFWEMDSAPAIADRLIAVDTYFDNTTTRDSQGRYTVRLPRKEDVYGTLGASRGMAVARLINQEKALNKNPHLAKEYRKFLMEYEQMGHMTRLPPFSGLEGGAYYLPHHAVVKESSTTTKERVVFNASAKTHTGLSLNSLLDPGHKQQQDLSQIILKWRKHRIVITGDIEKMFRQILVAPEDRDLQRIVWRNNPTNLSASTT